MQSLQEVTLNPSFFLQGSKVITHISGEDEARHAACNHVRVSPIRLLSQDIYIYIFDIHVNHWKWNSSVCTSVYIHCKENTIVVAIERQTLRATKQCTVFAIPQVYYHAECKHRTTKHTLKSNTIAHNCAYSFNTERTPTVMEDAIWNVVETITHTNLLLTEYLQHW